MDIANDEDGHRLGGLPTWNEKIVVDFPSQARFLTVEVHCKTYSGEKVVGMTRIRATDFSGGYFPDNYLHFLSYRLRDGKGERNGIINLSVRVKVPENMVSAAMCDGGMVPWMRGPLAVEGYSSGVVTRVPLAVEDCSSGVVAGVPVWHSYKY